MYIYITSKTMF